MNKITFSTQSLNYKTWFVLILVIFLIVYPPLLAIAQKGIEGPIRYFAHDAFYYLVVADQSVDAPFYTYDGLLPTNGFHPLWQYYLTFAFEFINTKEAQIFFAFYSSILFVALGMSLIALTLLRLTHSVSLTILGTIPGFYYLLFSPLSKDFLVAWAFINGMETPFSLFCFGIIIYLLIVKRLIAQLSLTKVFLVSLLLSILTLIRLDDIFIFLPWLLLLVLFSTNRTEIYQRLLVASVLPVLLIGSYLIYNFHYAEMLLPISGAKKSGFYLINNLQALLEVFVPVKQFNDEVRPGLWKAESWRILQIVIPLLLAIFWIIRMVVKNVHDSRQACYQNQYVDVIFTLLAVYIVAKALYNLINVELIHQGHWYFPVSIVIFNMMIVRLLPYQGDKFYALIAAVLIAIIFANSFIDLKRGKWYRVGHANIFLEGKRVFNRLRTEYDGFGILEFEDGIIGYSLDMPAMNGFGFTLDKQAYQAKQQGQLLEVAYHRGFRVLASLIYLHNMDKETQENSELLKAYLSSKILSGQDVSKWHFSFLFKDQKTKVIFVTFSPKD